MRLMQRMRRVVWSSAIASIAPLSQAEEPTSLPPLPAPAEEAPETSRTLAAPPAEPPAPVPPSPSPPPEKWRRQPVIAGGFVLGIGTPAGWIGGTLSYSPVDRFAIAAEVGLGTNGVQSGLMVHAYPIDAPKDSNSVARAGGGIGVSTGTYADNNILGVGTGKVYFRRAWFLNLEAGLLAWQRFGLEGEFVAGAAVLLNRGDGICTGTRGCTPLGLDPYVALRFRIGGWL